MLSRLAVPFCKPSMSKGSIELNQKSQASLLKIHFLNVWSELAMISHEFKQWWSSTKFWSIAIDSLRGITHQRFWRIDCRYNPHKAETNASCCSQILLLMAQFLILYHLIYISNLSSTRITWLLEAPLRSIALRMRLNHLSKIECGVLELTRNWFESDQDFCWFWWFLCVRIGQEKINCAGWCWRRKKLF